MTSHTFHSSTKSFLMLLALLVALSARCGTWNDIGAKACTSDAQCDPASGLACIQGLCLAPEKLPEEIALERWQSKEPKRERLVADASSETTPEAGPKEPKPDRTVQPSTDCNTLIQRHVLESQHKGIVRRIRAHPRKQGILYSLDDKGYMLVWKSAPTQTPPFRLTRLKFSPGHTLDFAIDPFGKNLYLINGTNKVYRHSINARSALPSLSFSVVGNAPTTLQYTHIEHLPSKEQNLSALVLGAANVDKDGNKVILLVSQMDDKFSITLRLGLPLKQYPQANTSPVTSVVASQSASGKFYIGDQRGQVSGWRLLTNLNRVTSIVFIGNQALKNSSGKMQFVRNLSLSQDDQTLFAQGLDQVLQQSTITTSMGPFRVSQSGLKVTYLDAQHAPTGQFLLQTVDGELGLWSQNPFKKLSSFGKFEKVSATWMSGTTVFAATQDQSVRAWRNNKSLGIKERWFNGHRYLIAALAYSDDGSLLYSIDVFGSLQRWQTSTGKANTHIKLTGSNEGVRSAFISPEHQQLTLITQNGTLMSWQLSTTSAPVRRFRHVLNEKGLTYQKLRQHPTNPELYALARNDGRIEIVQSTKDFLQVKAQTPQLRTPSPLLALAFDFSGEKLAFTRVGGLSELWTWSQGKRQTLSCPAADGGLVPTHISFSTENTWPLIITYTAKTNQSGAGQYFCVVDKENKATNIKENKLVAMIQARNTTWLASLREDGIVNIWKKSSKGVTRTSASLRAQLGTRKAQFRSLIGQGKQLAMVGGLPNVSTQALATDIVLLRCGQ